MDRTKLLSKIEKCLRLSKSSEPHEAAAALRQAQKMMEAHGVSEAELGAVGYGNEAVSVPIQVNKKLPIALATLVALIKKAFGVEAVVESELRVSDHSYRIRYFGPTDRVMLASYSQTVVHRAMEQAWKQHLADRPYLKGERGARAGFQLGWLDAVTEQVEALGQTDAEKTGTELAQTRHYGRELGKVKTNNMAVSDSALNAGAEAGAAFRLHRPVGSERLKLTRG